MYPRGRDDGPDAMGDDGRLLKRDAVGLRDVTGEGVGVGDEGGEIGGVPAVAGRGPVPAGVPGEVGGGGVVRLRERR